MPEKRGMRTENLSEVIYYQTVVIAKSLLPDCGNRQERNDTTY